ncbi:MAG: tetratricopeptide repeat protein [Proteobacteria bacterium]|nr:tetratricopeptide repeat protein [Pseudomonadota bacterium]
MKANFILFVLIFLFFPFYSNAQTLYPMIREIDYQDTPLYDFFIEYEKFYKNTFVGLFFELKINELDEITKKELYEHLVNKNALCKNDVRDISYLYENFCSFFNEISRGNLEKIQDTQFQDSVLEDLSKIFLSVQYGKLGLLDKVDKIVDGIKDQSLINFYRDLFRVVEGSNLNDEKLNYLSCIFNYYKDGSICIVGSDEDSLGILSFYKAKYYFNEGDYGKSAEFFLVATKNPKIKAIALENAVYSFFHAGKYDEALKYVRMSSIDVQNRIELLINLIRGNKILKAIPFLQEEGIDFFILNVVKEKIKKGDSLSFLREFKHDFVNEDLAFYLCLVSAVNKTIGDDCFKRKWSNLFYGSFIQLLNRWHNKNLNYEDLKDKREAEEFIEKSGLKNYYPFNFLLAEIAFENNNFEKAQKIYEYFIRYPKQITNIELAQSYYKLAMIFKSKRSYFTALKLLDKNLSDSFNGIRDKSRVEYVKITFLKDGCDGVFLYAPLFAREIKSEALKNEVMAIYNLCVLELFYTTKEQEADR